MGPDVGRGVVVTLYLPQFYYDKQKVKTLRFQNTWVTPHPKDKQYYNQTSYGPDVHARMCVSM